MVVFLLHHPRVQFYLVCLGALLVVLLWDCLWQRLVTRDGARTPPKEAVTHLRCPKSSAVGVETRSVDG
jgi:hypothetical protein